MFEIVDGAVVRWYDYYEKSFMENNFGITLKIALIFNSFFISFLIFFIIWKFLKLFFDIFKIILYSVYFNRKFLELVRNKKIILINGGIGSNKEILLFFLHQKIGKCESNPFFFIGLFRENKLLNCRTDIVLPYKDFLLNSRNDHNKNLKKTSFIYEIQDDMNGESEFSNEIIDFIISEIYTKNAQLFFSSFSNGSYWKEIEKYSDVVIDLLNYKRIFLGFFSVISFNIVINGFVYKKNWSIIVKKSHELSIKNFFGKSTL